MPAEHEPGYVPTPLELFRTIATRTIISYVILAAACGVIAGLTVGTPAVWGVLLGVGIAGAAMGLTLAVMMLTEKVSGINDMAVMLGSYLAKMVVLGVAFVLLRNTDFIDKSAMLLGFVAAIIVSLAVDTFTIARTRA